MSCAEILALTLRAEAGTRPVRAIEALAALVVNRARMAAEGTVPRARFTPDARAGAGWAGLLAEVCRAPFLFRCWQPGGLRAEAPADAAMEICRRVARRAQGGALPDPTAGATHWHDGASLPGWAIGQVPTAEIGGLVFYRLPA
ncbi:cell wall hydrolase [Belnapia rosea]|uniref:cell wall hydrolase n=1 Tax=Belnapia rosea TaxID=938405 RepID=UPI0008879CDF|nr:cell wall hydrolase [Belnapia rosea]SDB72112.1 Cell Wall Hydrolase [Belnapia rosea]